MLRKTGRPMLLRVNVLLPDCSAPPIKASIDCELSRTIRKLALTLLATAIGMSLRSVGSACAGNGAKPRDRAASAALTTVEKRLVERLMATSSISN